MKIETRTPFVVGFEVHEPKARIDDVAVRSFPDRLGDLREAHRNRSSDVKSARSPFSSKDKTALIV